MKTKYIQLPGLLLLFALLTMLVPGCISRQINLTTEEKEWLTHNLDSVVVEYDALFAPVEFSENGRYTGISSDVLKLVEEKLGIKFKQIQGSTDWPQTLEKMGSGEISIIPAMMKSEERSKHSYFTDPFINIPIVFISRKNMPSISLETMNNKKVAVVKDYITETIIRENSDTSLYTLVTVPNYTTGVRMLSSGEIDYFMDNLAMITWHMEKQGITNLEVAGETPYYFSLGIAVSKKYPILYSILNKAVMSISEQELRRVRQLWIAYGGESPTPIKLLIIPSIVVLLITLLLLYRDRRRSKRSQKAIKEAEAALGKQIQQISKRLPSTMVYQIEMYPDGSRKFTYVSDGVKKLHGVEPEAVLRDPNVLYNKITRDCIDHVVEEENRALENMDIFRVETHHTHPTLGEQWSILTSSPRKRKDGVVVWDGIEIDITDRKKIERELQQERKEKESVTEQLHHTQKMEAIGQLAGGVAHDFNNSLAAIIGATEILLTDMSISEENRELLEMIATAAHRSGDLTKQLLAFSRKGIPAKKQVDVSEILKNTVQILERTLDKNITIELNLLADSSMVEGDNSLIQNAFINIGINAGHAMPSGGTLTFATKNIQLHENYCEESHFSLTPGTYIQLSIQDTGSGIPPEVQRRIFEPFFTTKEEGKGTGLGLSAVYGTVEEHHGEIKVQSTPEEGTVFYINLPTVQEILTTMEAPEPLPEGTGTILVIDDEDMIRHTATLLLKRLGDTVITAENGAEGIAIVEEQGDRIDMVILDMIMPVLGGRKAFEKIHAMRPNLPVVISSGFSHDDDIAELINQGVHNFLPKPFRKDELVKVINSILHE